LNKLGQVNPKKLLKGPMLSNSNESDELLPEWISICTMISQNTAYLTYQGTMMLQKLTLLWMLKDKERKKENGNDRNRRQRKRKVKERKR